MTTGPDSPAGTARTGIRRRMSAAGRAAGARAAGVLAAGALAWANPAAAQIAETYRPRVQSAEQVEVLNRPRSAYDPIGGRIGSFFLYPTASLDGTYDDNIYGTQAGKTDDVFGQARLGASIESRWSRHRLQLDGYGEARRYAKRTTEDSESYGVHGSARYDRSRLSLAQLDLRFDRQPEDRLDVNALSSRKPVLFRQFVGTGLVSQAFGRLQLTGRAQLQTTDYSDSVDFGGAPLPQHYRDARRVLVTGIGRYELQGGAAVILAGTYDTLNYHADPVLDRDSHGYRLEAGLGLELSTLLTADVRVGYLGRRNDSPLLRNPKGVSFTANVVWNPTPLMTVTLVADRDIEESSSATIAGNLRAEARLTVDYELRRNIILSPSIRYANIDPVGSPLDSNETEEELRGRYLVSNGLRLDARLRHFRRGEGLYRSVSENSLTAGISFTL